MIKEKVLTRFWKEMLKIAFFTKSLPFVNRTVLSQSIVIVKNFVLWQLFFKQAQLADSWQHKWHKPSKISHPFNAKFAYLLVYFYFCGALVLIHSHYSYYMRSMLSISVTMYHLSWLGPASLVPASWDFVIKQKPVWPRKIYFLWRILFYLQNQTYLTAHGDTFVEYKTELQVVLSLFFFSLFSFYLWKGKHDTDTTDNFFTIKIKQFTFLYRLLQIACRSVPQEICLKSNERIKCILFWMIKSVLQWEK